MKLVRDRTGRFRERPHYELDELEEECERTALSFLEEQYGQVLVPIPTNALVVLIEQYATISDTVRSHPEFSTRGATGRQADPA